MKADTVLFDTETDGYDYTKLHCAAVYTSTMLNPLLLVGEEEFTEWAEKNTNRSTMWVAHNCAGFDYWVVNDLTGITIQRHQVVDTSVLTKLHNYRSYNTHSLREIGERLGVYKGEYEGEWHTYTPEMGVYCVQDVEVLKAIWDKYKFMLDDYPQAVNAETEIALILAEVKENGFTFNVDRAEALLAEVTHGMSELEDAMLKEWPDELVEDRRIQWRITKAGVPHAACQKAQAAAPKWHIEGDELVLYKYKQFNPGSSIDRVDKLWDAGWKPFDKTKGHIKYLREKR